MPIESGTVISDLDKLWPLSGDPLLEGDNHLRLIKSVLKTQFPGVGGEGFSSPITVSEQEINWLDGLTGNVQEQIDDLTLELKQNLYAPTGTVLVFYQASPPVGWTQLSANDDSLLRVVSGAGGGAGGSDTPIEFIVDHTHTTGDHILSPNEMPAHTHPSGSGLSVRDTGGSNRSTSVPMQSYPTYTEINTGSAGDSQPHNHGDTSEYANTFSPRYINMITAVKD